MHPDLWLKGQVQPASAVFFGDQLNVVFKTPVYKDALLLPLPDVLYSVALHGGYCSHLKAFECVTAALVFYQFVATGS